MGKAITIKPVHVTRIMDKFIQVIRGLFSGYILVALYQGIVAFILLLIFGIEGAMTCAIEFCSLSKTAGFTGTRCGYTVVPKALGNLNKMWLRRQTTKFNGVPYIIQRGAEAVFTEQGLKENTENISYY